MKRTLGFVLLAGMLSGCVHSDARDTQQLRQTYRTCISAAQDDPVRVGNCRKILNQLRQHQQHRAFAEQESVRTLDYQRCIIARKTGNDQAVARDCGRIWQEIQSNNR